VKTPVELGKAQGTAGHPQRWQKKSVIEQGITMFGINRNIPEY